jgi:hypothetical protein
MTDSGLPDVAANLTGQTAVVTGQKDVAPVAKILKLFAAEFKIAALKIGVVDKSILSIKELETLAELPSREILLAQLLGLLLSPATKLVRLLNEPAASLARLLNAKKESMPATPEPPKAAAPVPEPAPAAPEPAPAPPAAEAKEVKAESPKEEAPAAAAPTANEGAATSETPAATSEVPEESKPEGEPKT